MACNARLGNQPRRHGYDVARSLELAAPPVGSEELHKLALAVDGLISLAGASKEVLLKCGWRKSAEIKGNDGQDV